MELLYWFIPLVLVVGSTPALWFLLRRKDRPIPLDQARKLFQQERKRLELLFLQTASASGKPRGLRWTECQWGDSIAWVCEKQTGQLLALVGVTISFEAIEGGDMEGVEAVGNLRNASAVFFFQDGQWGTGGRAVFNLNPEEAVLHFKDGYERLG